MNCSHDFAARGRVMQEQCVVCLLAQTEQLAARVVTLQADVQLAHDRIEHLCTHLDRRRNACSSVEQARALIIAVHDGLLKEKELENPRLVRMISDALIVMAVIGA